MWFSIFLQYWPRFGTRMKSQNKTDTRNANSVGLGKKGLFILQKFLAFLNAINVGSIISLRCESGFCSSTARIDIARLVKKVP